MRFAAAWIAVLLVSAARAEPFSGRSGESGILDVPDAEALDLASVAFSGALDLREGRDAGDSVSPARLALGVGLGHGAEAAAAVREDGAAGEPTRAAALFGAALKLALWRPGRLVPGVAVDVTVDRINLDPTGAARLIASIARVGPLRVSGYAGAFTTRLRDRPEAGEGVAASLLWGRLELVADLVNDPGRRLVGGAIRWMLSPSVGIGAGASWFPRTGAVEGTLGIAVVASRPSAAARAAPAETPAAPEAVPPAPSGKTFPTDRPRFPVRSRSAPAPGEGAR